MANIEDIISMGKAAADEAVRRAEQATELAESAKALAYMLEIIEDRIQSEHEALSKLIGAGVYPVRLGVPADEFTQEQLRNAYLAATGQEDEEGEEPIATPEGATLTNIDENGGVIYSFIGGQWIKRGVDAFKPSVTAGEIELKENGKLGLVGYSNIISALSALDTYVAVKANIASPVFTGTPKIPNKTTAATNDGTLIASEAQVYLKADIDSPTFTGTPAAPKPDLDENSTRIATTDWVQELMALAPGTVQSVNEIAPNDEGNIDLTYVYNAQADYEADEANIPNGATIIKTYDKTMFIKTADGLKEVITNQHSFNSPDYANIESDNKITIPTADTGDRTYSWTVEKDGFIQFELGNESTAHYSGGIFGRINDARVLAVAEGWVWNDGVYAVKKGDIVSVNIPAKQANDNAKVRCYFIPPLYAVTEQTPLATDYYDISGETLALEPNTDWIAPYDCKIGIWVSINPAATAPQTASLKLIADGSTLFEDSIILGNSNASRVFVKDAILYKGQTFSYEVNSGAATYQKALSIHPRKYKSVTPQEFQYSTDEKWVGKYWIDGKKIYAKVLTGTFTAAANSSTDLELVEGVGDVVAVQAFWSTTNGTTTITSGEYHDSLGNRYASNIYKSGGDLVWSTTCPNARNNAPYVIKIEYTKA